MLERLLILAALALVAGFIAFVTGRRRSDPPSAPIYRGPTQLDRSEFVFPQRPVLVVVFSSVGCATCAQVWQSVEPLGSERVAVQQVDLASSSELHGRYRIDGVPTTVVADIAGVVVYKFFGPVSDRDLTEAVGSVADSAIEPTADGT